MTSKDNRRGSEHPNKTAQNKACLAMYTLRVESVIKMMVARIE